MAEAVFNMILAAECPSENFRQWFLELFTNEQTTKCSIEEFTVFFLNLIRNQTEEYNKNSSSSCNTPRKVIVSATGDRVICAKQSHQSTTGADSSMAHHNNTGRGDDGSRCVKIISRDLFASLDAEKPNELPFRSIKLLSSPSPLKQFDQQQSPRTPNAANEYLQSGGGGGGNLMYSEFTSDLKTTPTPIVVHHFNSSAAHAFSTPAKNIASSTSTPSSALKQQQFHSNSMQYSFHTNRSANSQNRNSQSSFHSTRYHSSNDSKSFDDNNSSTSFDISIGNNSVRSSHEKSKDMRRTANTSSICLGDFITTHTVSRQQQQSHSQKARKSMSSAHERNSPTNPLQSSHERDFPSFTPKGKPNRMALTPATATSLSSVSTSLSFSTPTNAIHHHHHQSSTTPSKSIQPSLKPTKRVVPTRIAAVTTNASNTIPNHQANEFNCPAFHSDNNILELTHEENADSTRDLLKSQKDAIRRVFQQEAEQMKPAESNLRLAIHESLGGTTMTTATAAAAASTTVKNVPRIDLNQITNKSMLDKFIGIYSIVLDLNLVTNILTELAYLVNLINLDANEYYERNPHMLDGGSEETEQPLLKNINNCIYFGLGVLKSQKNVLHMLDVVSIKVLLENERLTTLDSTIKDDLMSVYTHKMQLERLFRSHDTLNNITATSNNSQIKVFYHQDEDTQINFPTSRESVAFKKQRDHFYSILSVWEAKHLNPTWEFEMELGRKVRSMLNEMNHPINMAHMAKLFTAQLVLSCTVVFNEAIQSDLPNIDPSKLNKLHQRLVAPSHFSTNFQFPGNQAFFKDFIIAAEHQTTFIEQLKIILTNELINTNDSTYETLNLSTIDDENEDGVGDAGNGGDSGGDVGTGTGVGGSGRSTYRHEYIVKPETLSTMSVLAKFLGLIVARPYIYEFGVNSIVDNRQIELRNKIQTMMIDIKDILKKSIINHKLIVTLPWVVQFIAMLDPVSLRTDYYRDVFNILYELYAMTAECPYDSMLSMHQTSIFIIRSCSGWLFDQPNVPNEYYSYRQSRQIQLKAIAMTPISPNHTAATVAELKSVENFSAKDLLSFFVAKQHRLVLNTSCKSNDPSITSSALTIKTEPNIERMKLFDPLLEAVLQAACPFLADFRVSIMPRRMANSKVVSRTGRYRHITPKICESPPANASLLTTSSSSSRIPAQNQHQQHQKSFNDEADAQTKLVEAFLHSQTLSVRRTVEFAQERVYSAVVKDFQVEVLIPFKKHIVEMVDKIQLKDPNAILNELYKIYSNGEKELLEKWHAFVLPEALQRIKFSFDAHLPRETVVACKSTCINIAVQQALARINEWRIKNLNGIEIFSKDIQADVEKVLKNTLTNQPQMKTTFHIDLTKRPPWKTFDDIQLKLHQLSMKPKKIHDSNEIDGICVEIQNCLNEHTLPDAMYKTIGQSTVYLAVFLICNRHDLITKQIIEQFINLWRCKQFALFVCVPVTVAQPTNASSGSSAQNRDIDEGVGCEEVKNNTDTHNQSKKPRQIDTNYLFSMILSPLHILMQQHKPSASFECLAQFVAELIKNRLMTISFVNDQCLKLLNMEWEPTTLKHLAKTIQQVIDDCKNITAIQDNDNDNDAFFCEVLADLISGLDDIALEP